MESLLYAIDISYRHHWTNKETHVNDWQLHYTFVAQGVFHQEPFIYVSTLLVL